MQVTQDRRIWLYLMAGAVLGLALGGLVLVLTPLGDGVFDGGRQEPILVQAPLIGALAPEFELVSLAGGSVSLGEQQGKPVLLNFWATWCGPCVLEMPNIQKYYEKYPGQFEVLAINADEPILDVQRFVEDIGISFPVLLDPGGKIQELYRIRGYPMSFFVDSEGRIQIQHIGLLEEHQLSEYLSQLGVIE